MGAELDIDDVTADHPLAKRELIELRADAARLAWFFSDLDKISFMPDFWKGINEHWNIDQWRVSIDKHRNVSNQ